MKTQETGYPAVIKELETLDQKLDKLLPDPIQEQRKLFVESQIRQTIGPLEHAATLETGAAGTSTFGPMNDLAAHGIVMDPDADTYAPVQSPEAIEVVDEGEERIRLLQAKVDELYLQLETLTTEAILDYSKTSGGPEVVRTLLKRASVPDSDTVPLNVKTVEQAVELKKAQDLRAAEEAETNRKLEEQKKGGKTIKAL